MVNSLKCKNKQCRRTFPLGLERCPHCACPGVFSNVEEARLSAERKALAKRYKSAVGAAVARGCAHQVSRFEAKLVNAHAVINRSALETARLVSSDRELFSTFYQLLNSEVRLPSGEIWDKLRRIADEALFPGYKEKIRFAALSLDNLGLFNYGDCSLVLTDAMIAHRASVYHENSALFLRRHSFEPPVGYRAVWRDRARLCIAKLADRLQVFTPARDFAALLLRQGDTSEQDQFIEVHIWGPLSVYCLAKVSIAKRFSSRSPALFRAVRELLHHAGVKSEILQ
ncbi:MAG TPA: hypothetical protein VLX28_15500 [Thermoanaerobaculia bacterium]|nr:hypothetical protein [Thermoanaerobaculia bacterium]